GPIGIVRRLLSTMMAASPLSRKINFFIHIIKAQRTFDRSQRNSIIQFNVFEHEPATVSLASIMLDTRHVLCDQNIFSKRWNGAIVLIFSPTVVLFCGRGKDLDNNRRITNGIPMLIIEEMLPTDDSNIRIGVKARCWDFDPHIAGIDDA